MSQIEKDTTIIPLAVAESVISQAAHYVGKPISRVVATDLVNKAERIYKVNTKFRKKIKRADGLNMLYAFMRHWLASGLKRQQPDLFAKLPKNFINGEE